MSLDEIKNSKSNFLTPAEVSSVLGCDPQTLRLMAKQHPERLGFPCTIIGCRVKFPRIPFFKFMGWA